LFLGLLIFSCKKKKEAEVRDVGYDYYPSELGHYAIYEIDSTVYDDLTHLPTTFKYLIKEKLEEEFTDVEGKPAIRLMRYIKKYDSTKTYDQISWSVKDAWQVNISKSNVEVVEENVRFAKLAFPVAEGKEWDGNAKNSLGEWEYSYQYVDNAETVNGKPFENVASVLQKDYAPLILYQFYVEKYAKGVGLVYKEVIDLEHDVYPGTDINAFPNKSGVVYTMKIISYGHE
jgi:hypothetical protein